MHIDSCPIYFIVGLIFKRSYKPKLTQMSQCLIDIYFNNATKTPQNELLTKRFWYVNDSGKRKYIRKCIFKTRSPPLEETSQKTEIEPIKRWIKKAMGLGALSCDEDDRSEAIIAQLHK